MKPLMQALFAALVLTFAAWLMRSAIRAIQRARWSKLNRVILVLVIAISVVVARYSSTELTLLVKPTMQWHGFPLPVAIFGLEDGVWVDYVSEHWLQSWYAFVNFVTILSVGVALASFSSDIFPEKTQGRTQNTKPE